MNHLAANGRRVAASMTAHGFVIAAALLIAAGCTPATDLPEPPEPATSAADTPAATTDAAAMPTAAPAGDTPAPPEPAGTEAAETSAGEATAEPADGEGGAAGATATFTNTVFGYALDHPADWFVSDHGQTAMLSSFDLSAGAGSGGVPSDQTKVDILALEGFPLDLDARVAQIEAEAGPDVETEELLLPGGERAVWLRFSGAMAGDTAVVVTILGDELYQLQAYGNPEPLKAIAQTLRPTAPAPAP